MSRRRILPTYEFKDLQELLDITGEKIRVQAAVWTVPNSHPHDGGIFRVVKPYLDEGRIPPKGICKDCQKPMKEHGLIKNKNKAFRNDLGYKVCPGDWILLQNNEYWPCSPKLFEELYELLPKMEWYAN